MKKRMEVKVYCYYFILMCLHEERINLNHFRIYLLKSCCGFPDFPFLFCFPLFQTTPPAYEIENLKMPVAVWSGGHDVIADPKDIAMLLPQFTNLIFHEHFPDWEHLDFIWGLDAAMRMYAKIIDLIKKYP